MVDLLSPRQDRLTAMMDDGAAGKDAGAASMGSSPVVTIGKKGRSELPSAPASTQVEGTPTLRRQHSLPMFSPSSPPPPYPTFGPLGARFRVAPREDEGQERLPGYTNDVHLRAVLPRKVEFTKPGVQAKDRKWRRVLCELEGTVFRVYRAPAHISGVSPLTQWWEDKVGAGDIAQTTPVGGPSSTVGSGGPGAGATQSANGRIHIPVSQNTERQAKIGDDAPQASGNDEGDQERRPRQQETEEVAIPRDRSRSRFGSGVLGRSRLNVGSSPSASSSRAPSSRPSMSSDRTSSESSGASKDELPDPDPKDLIRTFTLQGAESGLGSDYVKRKNVIRVRMEGEQFLLQAPDVVTVVDWIEGLQAATNIALDLDERPMPRGPLFPRRRRRRVRRAEAAAAESNTNGNGNRPAASIA